MAESQMPISGARFEAIDGRNIVAGQQVSGGIVNNNFHGGERPETPPMPFALIPFRRDPDFVDREDILDRIAQQCSEPAGRMALVGLGGVGKSQLAIEFAHRTAARSAEVWVFWVHAGTRVRVEEGFRTIADAVKLPGRNRPGADLPQLVYNWLSNERNGQWVMVLDSADDCDVFYKTNEESPDRRPLATYFPQSRNGSILITTRVGDLGFGLTGNYRNLIEIGPMTEADALTLLENRLGSLSDVGVATDLVRALDLIPLAISQAAAYIQTRAPRCSLEKYLAEFRESERKKIKLLGHEAYDLSRDGGASNAILTTWQISFDHIRSNSLSAANLLSLMSFFDRQGIPERLLKPSKHAKDAARVNGLDETGDSGSDDSDCDTDDDTDDTFEDDVRTLRAYCLITMNETGDIFEMHGLVQLSIRKSLGASGLHETFKHQFIDRIAAAFPTGGYSNWTTCRPLFAHVEAAVNHRPNDGRLENWATLLYNGGWYAESQGWYDIAEQMAYKAWRAREKKMGNEDKTTLKSIMLFARVRLDQGLYKEAEKLCMQVMETRKTKLGADHPDTLSSIANLASTYWNQGRWEDAEKLGAQIMETFKTKLGADYPDTLTSMNNLAAIYMEQGRWKEAEKLEVQVMETRKTKLGVDHPDTLTSIANLALTYMNQGRWGEAEKLGAQVIETRIIKLGADHPDTLTSMNNLASIYWNQGRWKEAEKLFIQVMETSKTKLGADHPDTLTSIANLALTYMNQGRWEEAEKLFIQVMETLKTKLGADHPNTLVIISNLAVVWNKQGRYADALALMENCAQTRQRVLGPEHPDTLKSVAFIEDWST